MPTVDLLWAFGDLFPTAVRFLTQALACNCSLASCLRNVSFMANCFRRPEVTYAKKLALLHEFDVRCCCCHNCSEHNNRNCPVSGKITPAEVAGSSWGLVCVSSAVVGVAPAPAAAVASVFQLPSHR